MYVLISVYIYIYIFVFIHIYVYIHLSIRVYMRRINLEPYNIYKFVYTNTHTNICI